MRCSHGSLIMHILIGALVGAVFAVGMTVGMSLLTGRKPVWKHVALAALGGAVSGAIASATLGAGGFAAAGLGRQVVGMGLGGAVGGATERVAENAVEGKPLEEGVVRSTVVGAGAGVVSLGVTRGSGLVLARVAPRAVAAAPVTASGARGFVARVMAAPTPGTGRGFLRGLEARREANEHATVTIDLPLGSDVPTDQATGSAAAPAGTTSPAQADEEGPARIRAPTPGMRGALAGTF